MNLTEGFLRDNLFIDFGSEILYGSDQMFVTFPLRLATVNFPLMSTAGLSQIADRIRKDRGFVPLSPMDEYTNETCDSDAWYDFSIGISDIVSNDCDAQKKCRVDNCIEVVVVNSYSPDNEAIYTIDLSESERECVYSRLDEQCGSHLGKSCKDLIAEAREEILLFSPAGCSPSI